MTALHWTAKKGQREVAKLLIDNGAATNAVDNNGRTALRWAEIEINPGVGELLGGESRLAVAAQMTVGGVIVGGLIAGVCAIGVVPLAVTGLVVGGVVAAANAPAPVYDGERRRRLEAAAGGAQPGSLHYYQRT